MPTENPKFSELAKRTLKQQFATCGLNPSHRMETLNLFLEFGKWQEKNDLKVKFETRYDLYQYLNNEVIKNAPIDYLEFGVWKGKSMGYWHQLNQHPDSRFFGFDTFEGLPEEWKLFTKTLPKGTFDADGKVPEITDPRVKFIKGIFQKSLTPFLNDFNIKNRLIIHCDADLYTSTLYVLAKLDHLIIPGSVIIFDEFASVSEFRAFRDFSQAFKRECKLLAGNQFLEQVALEFE